MCQTAGSQRGVPGEAGPSNSAYAPTAADDVPYGRAAVSRRIERPRQAHMKRGLEGKAVGGADDDATDEPTSKSPHRRQFSG